MTEYCYTRSGAGTRRGGSWRDARPFAQMASDIGGARAGDRFSIGFPNIGEDPLQPSSAPIVLASSGAPGAPIRIEAGIMGGGARVNVHRGANGPRFFSSPNAMTSRAGAPIRAAGRVANAVLEGFRIDGASADGFVKFTPGEFSDFAIRNIASRNVGRVIETERGAALRRVTIEDCQAYRIGRGFARFRQLDQSVLRNLDLDADSVDLGGENVTQLIAVTAGRDVRFENIRFRNAVNTRDYVQGDGLVCERGTARFVVRDCSAENIGDGAFDLKTTDVEIENCRATRCKYGFRIWSMSRNTLRRCVVREPRRFGRHGGACVETRGRADLHDCDFEAGSDAAVFRLTAGGEGPPTLRMFGGVIRMRDEAPLVTGAPDGVIELHDVTVNGALRSGRFTAEAA